MLKIKNRRCNVQTMTVENASQENEELVKNFIINGFEEQKKKLQYTLMLTNKIILKFEKKFGITTSEFLQKFMSGEIEENSETFEWWAESKLLKELQKKIR